MAKLWREVSQDPTFQALPAEEQEVARAQYFEEVVAPQVPTSEIETVRSQFDSDTGPSIYKTAGTAAKDLAVSFGAGANSLLEMGGTVSGLVSGDMDNWARRQGESGREFYQGLKSPELRAKEQAKQEAIDKQDGEIAKFVTALKETASDPVLFSNFLAEQIPNLVGAGIGGRVIGGTAKALGAGAKTTAAAATTGAVGTGAALQGADSGGDAYDRLKDQPDALVQANDAYKKLIDDGVPEIQAREQISLELARWSAIKSAAVSAGVNLIIPGARSVERVLGGGAKAGPGGFAGAVKGGARGFVGEGIAESTDEAAGRYFANRAVKEVDPSQSLTEGVGQALAEGALFAPFGGVAGAVEGGSVAGPVAGRPTDDEPTPNAVPGATPAEDVLGRVDPETQPPFDPSAQIPPYDPSTLPKVDLPQGDFGHIEPPAAPPSPQGPLARAADIAAQSQPVGVQPGSPVITRPNNQPFETAEQAQRAATVRGIQDYAVQPVEGGFVLAQGIPGAPTVPGTPADTAGLGPADQDVPRGPESPPVAGQITPDVQPVPTTPGAQQFPQNANIGAPGASEIVVQPPAPPQALPGEPPTQLGADAALDALLAQEGTVPAAGYVRARKGPDGKYGLQHIGGTEILPSERFRSAQEARGFLEVLRQRNAGRAQGQPIQPQQPPVQPQAQGNGRNQVNPAKDDLITAIAKIGGLDAAEAERQGLDPAIWKTRGGAPSGVFGRPWLRKSGGMSFDAMAEALNQYGFFPPGTPYSPNALLDMLGRQLGGDRVFAPTGAEAALEQQAEQRDIDEAARALDEQERAIFEQGLAEADSALDDATLAQINEDLAVQAATEREYYSGIEETVDETVDNAADSQAPGPEIAGEQTQDNQRDEPGTRQEAGQTGTAGEQDLLGPIPTKEQALADAKRKVDERLSGEPVPVGEGKGDLFTGASKQLDIADAQPAKQETKEPWQMTQDEFAASVKRGKLHQRTGRTVPGEAQAKTPLRVGELNGYSGDDIAHFYAARRGYPSHASADYDPIEAGREQLIRDAVAEKKPVPAEVLADYPDLQPAQDAADRNESALDKALLSVGLDPDAPPDKVKSLRREADKLMQESRQMLERIPMGQPIVSTADRNLRERSTEKARKASDLYAEAEALEAKQPATAAETDEPTPSPEVTAITSAVEKMASVVDKLADKVDAIGKPVVDNKSAEVDKEPGMVDAHEELFDRLRDGDVTADQETALFSRPGTGPRSQAIPKAAGKTIHTFVNDIPIKAHADYKAAKAGDFEAAVRLVRDLVKPANLEAARQQFGADVVFVPAVAVEASGQNQIPRILAEYYAAETGSSTSVGEILQTSKAYHTGAGPMERLIARPAFGGTVEVGKKYVLVDDVTTMGGTLAEMAHHIQSEGGEIAGIVTLVNAGRSDTMIAEKQQINEIERRYGDEIRQLFGIEPAALTRDEATYILGFRDVDGLRNRAATAKRQRSERLRSKGIQEKVDSEFAQEVLSELASVDEFFRFPVSESSSLEQVMSDVFPEATYSGEDTRADERAESGADRRFVFKTKPGKTFYVFERGNEVWIDVSRLEEGERGSAVYAAVGNYAHNASKRFVGDPNGLSEAAIVRRTSNMLSLALRFGTTRFMKASPEQVKGDPAKGIAPLAWRGDDVAKTRALIDTFLSTLHNQFPRIKNARYDFQKRQFIGRDGMPIDRAAFQRIANQGVGREARAGEATLRRGIFIQSLISSESGQRPGILEQVLSRGRSLVNQGGLQGLLSRGATALIQPRPRAGVFVSGLSLRDAKATIARVTAGYKNLPPIIPHERIDQAPSALLAQIEDASAGDVKGAFHMKEIHLFLENIASEEEIEHVLIEHEVAHYGMRGVFGGDVDKILNHIYLTNETVRKAATKRRSELGLRSNIEAVEEVLADMPTRSLVKLKGWDKLISRIRDWLMSHGFTKLAAMLNRRLEAKHGEQGVADLFVADVLKRSREWARSGKQSAATDIYMGVTRLSEAGDGDGGAVFSRKGTSTEFHEENERLREKDNTAWIRAKRFMRRQFLPGGLLPKSIFDEKISRDSNFNAIEFYVRHQVGGLENAVRADYGVKFTDLPKDTLDQLSQALSGKVPEGIPEKTRTAIYSMRQYIDALSTDYAQMLDAEVSTLMAGVADPHGALFEYLTALERGSQEDAEAVSKDFGVPAEALAKAARAQTIRNNIGEYVHRSYQAFDDPKWFKKLDDATINAARAYLVSRYDESGETAAESRRRAEIAMHEILKTGTAYDSFSSFVKEGKLGAKDLSVMIRRKQIAPEIRALLGEYQDARLNYAKSATKMGRLIWNQKFLDAVRKRGMGVFLFEGVERPPQATKQITGEANESYAPLNGLWTFPDVEQALRDALGKEHMDRWYETIVQLNGMVKFGKTVLSPTTAARNWQSAMFFALANGHFDLSHISKSVSGLREYFTHQGEGAKLAYLQELLELGVIYDNPYAGEMMRLLADSKLEEKLLRGKDPLKFGQAMEYAQKFYQYGDDFWKIVGFENEKNLLMKHAGMNETEAKKEAANRIRNTYPTYSMVGRAMNFLRRFPLAGTFVSFPSEIVRTVGNMIGYMAQDMKTPGMRPLALRRIAGFTIAGSFAYALQEMTKLMMGIDDDDEEAVRDLAATWSKNSNFLFLGRDENGLLQYIDLSYVDPYNYFKRPVTAILRDQPWEKIAADVFRETLEPFLGTDIAAGAIFEALSNRKESGGQVYTEGDKPWLQAGAIANHLRKTLQPGIASNLERTYKAIAGEVSQSGKKFDPMEEAAGWMGWRMTTLDPKVAMYYRTFEFKDVLRDASAAFNKTARDPNKISDAQLRAALERSWSLREDAFRQMSRIVNAAKSSGLSDAEVTRILRSSQVSMRDIVALRNGKVPRWRPSMASEQGAIRKARTLLGQETEREFRRRYREAIKIAAEKNTAELAQ